MSVLERLSSVAGDPSEASNKAVARQALEQPEILDEVAAGLEWDDRKLVGDCAEVFTEVAKENPALVAPYVGHIASLISHRDTRVRWESVHVLALVASLVPEQVAPLLPDLVAKIERLNPRAERAKPLRGWCFSPPGLCSFSPDVHVGAPISFY